ncbi:hypothetical protein AYX13_00722 [Cryptococcus neoformans]|nr:hypothetical protein AYX13_00722 [Cryptococcus neoformans var. grubii]
MSLLASTVRRAPNSLQLSTRNLSTTSARLADAAPIASRYVRKTAVPARAKPAAYSRPATFNSASTAASRTRPAPASRPVVDEFPEDLLPSTEPPIDDYAHLSAPPSAKVSPPLSELPSENYEPLPSATASARVGNKLAGEAPVGLDWSTSFSGLSEKPFPKEAADELLKPLTPGDVEIKPDGLLYLPEIKYRRTLNAAFGPGGWGLAPRGDTDVGPRIVSREWGLVCLGRLVSVARGEQEYFDPSGIATATEACKSNALMRCCKDLGIASELWDPTFIRDFKKQHCVEVFVEHAVKKNKKKLWRKKNSDKFEYPWKEL